MLARPEGAGPGTKGLSLFVVPKFHVDLETGELGERNGVFATNVEHKMGLKVSTTCELTFGEVDGIPAVGTLLGEVHDGIAQMFQIIEYARMMVGTKAIATLSSGYLNALDYAKERVQGADLTQMADKTAPRVTITHHPDVRRSLMTAEGVRRGPARARALHRDVPGRRRRRPACAASRTSRPSWPSGSTTCCCRWSRAAARSAPGRCSAPRALQTLGGSGFLQDYPLEQYVRDAKIDTLYEGTTAIQGLDFFFRKIVRDKGAGARPHLGPGAGARQGRRPAPDDALARERELLGQALEDVQAIVGSMVGAAAGRRPAGAAATRQRSTRSARTPRRLLLACTDLLVGWLLLRQAEVATSALAGDGVSARDRAFYEGKVAAARFFAATVLPTVTAERAIAEGTDNGLMELAESAF